MGLFRHILLTEPREQKKKEAEAAYEDAYDDTVDQEEYATIAAPEVPEPRGYQELEMSNRL